jgi:hypothetical protein
VFDRPGPSGWHAVGDEGKRSGKTAPAAAMAEAAGLQAMGASRASYLPTGERASELGIRRVQRRMPPPQLPQLVHAGSQCISACQAGTCLAQDPTWHAHTWHHCLARRHPLHLQAAPRRASARRLWRRPAGRRGRRPCSRAR